MKSMKKFIIFLLLSALILTLLAAGISACGASKASGEQGDAQSVSQSGAGGDGTGDTSGGGTADGTGKEARYYPTSVEGYKTAHNEAFDFWFDIPEDWKAIDKSKNGDGYYIISDNAGMDIRVYGLIKSSTEEEYYRKLSGNDGQIEDFTFNDGEPGKKIRNLDSRVYFVRVDEDTFICFYVNYTNNAAWYEANQDKLTSIAMSIRIRKEGPKLDSGENKISLDDLKLGEISIDMPYEEVKNKIKAGIVSEDTDEYQGKTLFYDDGTEIYIIDDTVYSMNVNTSSYATPKGLKVGDDKSRVVELYGEPDNKEDDTYWGYTYDGYELFSVVLKDGKVAELQIDTEE